MKIHEIRDSNLSPEQKYKEAARQAAKALEWMGKQPIEKQLEYEDKIKDTLNVVSKLEYECKLGFDPIEETRKIMDKLDI